MNDEDLTAYLKRLDLEAEPPSAAALHRLHRAHVEHVPYDTFWLHLGEQRTVDPGESVVRVAHQRKGGYCFHLNGAFSELLAALGYDVTRHVGGVHGADGMTEDALANHLVLSVRGLPSDENPDGEWYVDAGLGDALYEPLPLRTGEYDQGPFRYTLTATPGEVAGWEFTHDQRGSFAGMGWRSAAARMSAFAAQHTRLSTAPDSMFVQFLILQRRHALGVDGLVGIGLRRVDAASARAQVLTERRDWFAALTDIFDFPIDTVPRDALDRLFDANLAQYREVQENRAADAQ